MNARFLLCSPDHFDVTFEINPWMTTEQRPDRPSAWRQWRALVANLRAAGAEVFSYESRPGLSDMVFPTDVAVAVGRRFLRGRFRHPERRAEAAYGAAWLIGQGYEELEWPGEPDLYLEGGDTVGFGDTIVCGTGFRTSAEAARYVGVAHGVDVVSVPLVDPRFYHLDMSFCPLDGRRAICATEAWDESGQRAVAELVPEQLVITSEEALTFCANAVVVGETIVMPACPPRVRAQLEEWGFRILVSGVSEFIKAGGGIRCMSLDLDLLRRSTAQQPA
ncbi:MAG: amidinotransferase [Catenulispora sp.]|nr:amidinotransferase [Catenulispora sp.]